MSDGSHRPYNSGATAVPYGNTGAQEILKQYSEFHGFIRKRGKRERIFENFKFAKILISGLLRWRQRFVVISKGCLYIYSNENSDRPLHSVHLFGYHRMYLMSCDQSEWAFRLESIEPLAKVHYFSCVDDADRKEWMKRIRDAMSVANGKQVSSPPVDVSDVYSYLLQPVFTQEEDHAASDDDDEDSSDQSNYDEITDEIMDMANKRKPNIPLPAIPESDGNSNVKEKRDKAKQTASKVDKNDPDYINQDKTKSLPQQPKANPTKKAPAAAKSKATTLPGKKSSAKPTSKPSEDEYMFYDNNREKALRILKDNPQGTYLVRMSRNQDGKVLAVQTDQDIKEYRIFKKDQGITLNNRDYFQSMEDLLHNYQTNTLPNRTISLTRAFSQNDVRF